MEKDLVYIVLVVKVRKAVTITRYVRYCMHTGQTSHQQLMYDQFTERCMLLAVLMKGTYYILGLGEDVQERCEEHHCNNNMHSKAQPVEACCAVFYLIVSSANRSKGM